MSLKNHSAPGSAAAFIYQLDRALYLLAKSPEGHVIGIETDDDVVDQRPDGHKVLEQDKHSIQALSNPFGDRSFALWNTLATWLKALDDKEIKLNNTSFLLATNKTLPDCIAREICNATEDKTITQCIKSLKLAAIKPPKGKVASHMCRVLSPASRNNLAGLIKNCSLDDGSGGTILSHQTISYLQLPAWCTLQSESILNELSGWLKTSAMNEWNTQKPCWIHRNHFVNQLHAILDNRKRKLHRERAENLITVTKDEIGQQKGRPFVKQVHLISDDEDLAVTSISDFIRCSNEMMRLSTEGEITDDDWSVFGTILLTRWKAISTRTKRLSKSKPDEDIGFEIFAETTMNYKEKLAGEDTEQSYLTSGMYHRLADSLDVGWHPMYLKLMRNKGDE